MKIELFQALEWGAYLIVLVSAIFVSWKKGEKEGSVFMLEYLRENKFMNDTDYANFMRHVRSEKTSTNAAGLSPNELKKKNEKEEDISSKD